MPDQFELDQLERLATAAYNSVPYREDTGWHWSGHGDSGYPAVLLSAWREGHGRCTVMDFDRWGMQGAQPRFPDGLAMRDARDLLTFEVGTRGVVGIDAAKRDPSVYRYEVDGIAHPIPEYVAACHPKVVLALIAEVRAALATDVPAGGTPKGAAKPTAKIDDGHTCDAGHFDRTICPEPCGSMHFYCSGCGARQDVCTHDVTVVPGQDLEIPTAETVADALIRYETSGMCHYGKTCGLCDCGKADEQTQTRDAMELDRARAVLALFPEQRCAPTEEEVARLIEPDAWALSDMEWHEDYGRTTALGRSLEERSYIRRSANARARNIAKLYADQPTVAQAKADALREAAMDWTDFDAAAMGTPAAWFRARAAAIEKGAHDG